MAHIMGTGRSLPDRILDNAELAASAGVTEEWILRRTGIRERRIAARAAGTVTLGANAARAALDSAGIATEDVDLIVVATSTPDHLTPPTAAEIQARLGATPAACFDVEAGFAGWIYALIVADALIQNGMAEHALVIGAETLSTVTDRADPKTGPLFGDGAGAIVLGKGSGPLELITSSWWADGRLAKALLRPAGGARRPFDERALAERAHLLRMEGTRIFRQSIRTMAAQARTALERAGLGLDEIGLVIPHQANLRILKAFSREVGISMDRVFVNIDRYGNTGGATIPIALDEAGAAGLLANDRPVLLVSFGAGATAGAVVLRP